jgi:hypothetical protein
MMLKAKSEGAMAEYEKMQFEVAPFLVYLTRPSQGTSPNEVGAVAAQSGDAPNH